MATNTYSAAGVYGTGATSYDVPGYTFRQPAIGLEMNEASGTANLADNLYTLYVGTAGDVRITTLADQDITLTNLVAGVFHPIACKKVWSTGTTASDIVGGYIGD